MSTGVWVLYGLAGFFAAVSVLKAVQDEDDDDTGSVITMVAACVLFAIGTILK